MSDNNQDDPQNITPEQINAGIDKFITMLEEEIKIHHSHPEWMDLDEQCVEEKNLIVRAGLILTMLEKVISQFKLANDDSNVRRIKAARNYVDKIN